MATRFAPRVLRVEGPVTKKLKKALASARPVEAVVALLGKQVDAAQPPAWIVFTASGPLDEVVHLEAPVFAATGADEDEFYSEPPGAQIVLGGKGKGTLVDKNGNTSPIKIAPKDLRTITAYDAGGFLLASIRWIDAPPKDFAATTKLLKAAVDAYTGDMSPYELPEREPSAAAGAPAPATLTPFTPPAPGSGGMFLGGPARTSSFAAKVSRTKPKIVWTSSYENNGGAEHGGCPVVADGLIFAGDSGYNAKCSATNLAGKTVWKIELTKGQSWIIGSACVDRGVLYQPTNQGLYAIAAQTGKVKWMAKLSATSGSPLVIGDQVFVGSGEGVFGLSLLNGRKQWKFLVKRNKYKEGVLGGLAYADGALFFLAEEKLLCVDVTTAKKRWATPASARATPSLDETSVYTWSDAGLTAFDRATGKERWHRGGFEGYSNSASPVAVAGDRVVVRADGKLVAVAKSNGKVLWQFADAHPYQIGCASPTIAGDVVLSVLVDEPSSKSSLHAIDLATGKALWKVTDFPLRKKESAALSWYCTPWVEPNGTILVQAYGIQALR